MPGDRATYDEIVQDAHDQIAERSNDIRNINVQMNAIRRRAAGHLTPADQTALDNLDHTRNGHLATIRTISLVTLEALDKTEEARRLVEQLNAVRTDLEARRARIQHFAETAEAVGNALAGVARLATRIDEVKEDIQHIGDKPKPKPKPG